MYISKVSLVNYRNFANSKLLFKKGVNTIIGENGSGKTNLFRAIRLLLDDRMIRSANRLDEQDFCRFRTSWKGHWIFISIEFEELSQDEAIQSLFLHNVGIIEDDQPIHKATYNLIFRPKREIRKKLSELEIGDHSGMSTILNDIVIDDYETIFTGKSTADFNDEFFYRKIVGDFEEVLFSKELDHPEIGSIIPRILSLQKEISLTFIQALRDVVSDFHDSRRNPLISLLKVKSGEINIDSFQPIADQVIELNNSIENFQDVQDVRGDIGSTMKSAVGETYSPSSLAIKSDLPSDAEKLFQSLKLFVAESDKGYEEAIHDLSLGGANLIYLTLKLLEFKYQKAKETFANFLLIEEPEAHIHTHIQKNLFDRLNFSNTQIIYSTHSTHISEASNIQHINILSKAKLYCEAYQPCIGLEPSQSENIQRYLDAVRSNLLFAKSIILVEGDAEEILIPILVKKVLGISLDELGISLINIRSTGFENIALLFHDCRIRKKCSIITDLDKSIIDTEIFTEDSDSLIKFKNKCKKSEESGAARKVKLDEFYSNNSWVNIFYASHTFEVDFVRAGNKEEIKSTIHEIYTQSSTLKKASKELESNEVSIFGRRVLRMANNIGKGWFAVLVGKKITHKTRIPSYILDSIFHASPELSSSILINIFQYRIRCMQQQEELCTEELNQLNRLLQMIGNKNSDFISIKNRLLETTYSDQFVYILNRFIHAKLAR